jgi:pimeloyl-ACP methyl ester carboxylesterase
MAASTTVADKFATANGLRVHYLEWANSGAPTIVMLHGLRSYAHVWDGVARPLASDYHILALDQRGRGDSDWSSTGEYHTEAYVSDLEQVVGDIGLDRFILMGHSMGGANTLVYASRHPAQVTAAVIEDMGPASTSSSGSARISREIEETPKRFASWEEAEAFWRKQRPLISPEALEERLRNTLKRSDNGEIVWKWDLEGIAGARTAPGRPQVDLWPAVRSLTCPTLVIRGGASDILAQETAEAMAASNANVSWVEVPNASHFVHEDNLTTFNREVQGFLKRVS